MTALFIFAILVSSIFTSPVAVKTVTVFPAKHLVAVEGVTTPLRKKRGIASFVIHLKTNEHSNEVKVHIQNDTLLNELEKMLTL